MLSLYFHIPFCTQKCPYCHFYVIPNKRLFHQILGEALLLEWEKRRPLWEGKKVASIYFGGGTPTLFRAEGIGSVLERISRDSDCEITIEGNPEECTPALFEELLAIGINRLSLGVQSLDESSLLRLERIHSAQRAKRAVLDAAKAGFKNISIDLMYDLPEQTEESWRRTLDQALELPVSHLSLYNLTIEPHTVFHKRKVRGVDEETSVKLLYLALQKLDQAGFERYEISAFARDEARSRHNLGYWTGRPFLGFGPSAFSYWEGERFRNVANLQRYARELKEGGDPIDFREKLPYPANVKELLAIGLRVKEGVDLSRFGAIPEETIRTLNKLVDEALVFREGARIRLTERGMLFYDTLAAELI